MEKSFKMQEFTQKRTVMQPDLQENNEKDQNIDLQIENEPQSITQTIYWQRRQSLSQYQPIFKDIRLTNRRKWSEQLVPQTKQIFLSTFLTFYEKASAKHKKNQASIIRKIQKDSNNGKQPIQAQAIIKIKILIDFFFKTLITFYPAPFPIIFCPPLRSLLCLRAKLIKWNYYLIILILFLSGQMGKVIRCQRKGKKGSVYTTPKSKRIAPPRYRNLDFAERQGYIRGVVRAILHDPGRGCPLIKVDFRDPYKYKKQTEYFLAAEGTYSGQYLFCGRKATVSTGNVLPVNQISEGTTICNIESSVGDKGSYSRCSGTYATIVGHSDDGTKTRIRLPSGSRKTIPGACRATVGIIAGGGRNEKPIMKAGVLFHKFKRQRKRFPKVAGVRMNPVDHPHGGGNHKHLGKPGTVSRFASAGQKVGLIAARRTGLIRGTKTVKNAPEKI